MEAIRISKVLKKDGEINLTGLPYKKGQNIEMILLSESPGDSIRPKLTAHLLLNSGLVGIWKDRKDIDNSSTFARKLREEAQNRRS